MTTEKMIGIQDFEKLKTEEFVYVTKANTVIANS
jgi:hypothetical protein